MKTLITTLVAIFLANQHSAQNTDGIAGKIITEHTEGLLKIKATAISTSSTYYALNYIMVSVKKGTAGNSTNKQSGKFTLNPEETKTLAETTIRMAKNDGLKVYLFIKEEQSDRVLAKDSLEINAAQFGTDVSYIPENKLELSGLTIDDTKTRMGQLFYESFFKKYNQIPKKFEATITISEIPSFGRNSRITVSQDDQLIHSFFTKPDEELLEAEASRALAILVDYNSRKNVRNTEFKY